MFTAFDVAPTIAAVAAIGSIALGVATWWNAQRQKRADRDIGAIRATHEALVGTIREMETAMLRQDVEHAAEVDRLRKRIERLEASYRGCEQECARLNRQLAGLRRGNHERQ